MKKYILYGFGLLTMSLLVSLNLNFGCRLNVYDVNLSNVVNAAIADDSEGGNCNGEGGIVQDTMQYITDKDHTFLLVTFNDKQIADCIYCPAATCVIPFNGNILLGSLLVNNMMPVL